MSKVHYLALYLIIMSMFLQKSYSQTQKTSTQFIYVNGGYNETSNYSIHEKDLLAFKQNLFHGSDIKIFNAGGPGGPVLQILENGDFLRDYSGFIKTTPSTITNTEKATKSNIEEFFSKLGKDNSKNNVTIVWGDHGGYTGVALWDTNDLSANDINTIYSNISSTTLIRAIHIHCHSGAAMSGPMTPMPLNSHKKLESFINKKYPINRCGLSLSDFDELGQYLGWSKDSKWENILMPGSINLNNIRDRLQSDSSIYPTIMLTSDYFLRDLKNTLCQKNANEQTTEADFCITCNKSKLNKDLIDIANFYKNVCKYTSNQVETLNNYSLINSAYGELTSLENYLKAKYVEKTFPDFYKDFKLTVERLNNLKKQLNEEKNLDKKKKIILEIEQNLQGSPLRYLKFIESIDQNKNYQEFKDKMLTYEFLQKNGEKYPELSKLVSSGYFKKSTKDDLRTLRETLSKSRSQALKAINKERKELAGLLMSNPKFKILKDRYENILNCENSNLN